MSHRSNAAEAWYSDPQSTAAQPEIPLDLLPPPSLTQPLWRSLVGNLRDTLAPTKLPPLELTSRPVNVGLLLGDRLRLPWYRTVFTNIGDVISPETLPPLELETRPVDVGELITDQLSHFWWGSLLRNLADRVAPETQPVLHLTAKPILDIIPKSWILLPLWSEVVDTPKVFYPDKPKPADAARSVNLQPAALSAEKREAVVIEPTAADLLRDLRRSRIRQRIWIGLATAQILYMAAMAFGKL
ncbi:MAG TPA: hypothetical protein VE957_23485 [Terriglobales bacterium]|nr:hypothetical protein [Terriglobales bacterium]